MAEFDDSGERSEEPTDARREEFRKRGEVAQTRELASALLLLSFGGLLYFGLRYFISYFHKNIHRFLDIIERRDINFDTQVQLGLNQLAQSAFDLIFPILLISLILGVLSFVLQTGFIFVEQGIRLDFQRVNPVNGFKKLFSLTNVFEVLKSLIKFSILAFLLFLVLSSDREKLLRLGDIEITEAFSLLTFLVLKLSVVCGGFLIVIAILDYGFRYFQLEKRMMMTKQELKEELKNREIDPLIKMRLRKLQRDISQRRMMAQVPKASVVITNPTHIAVALQYEPNFPAPKLIAKGADKIAEKIKEIARQHNIPIVENKPLARIIFKTMKLDQFIPRELYVAVAEVLSYVYRLKKRK